MLHQFNSNNKDDSIKESKNNKNKKLLCTVFRDLLSSAEFSYSSTLVSFLISSVWVYLMGSTVIAPVGYSVRLLAYL